MPRILQNKKRASEMIRCPCLDPPPRTRKLLRQYCECETATVGGNRSAGSRTRVEADDTVFVRAEVAHAGLVISQRRSTHRVSGVDGAGDNWGYGENEGAVADARTLSIKQAFATAGVMQAAGAPRGETVLTNADALGAQPSCDRKVAIKVLSDLFGDPFLWLNECLSGQQPMYRLAKLPTDCQKGRCPRFFFSRRLEGSMPGIADKPLNGH